MPTQILSIVAISSLILAGCQNPTDAEPPPTPVTCTLVGCGDLVSVKFPDLLLLAADKLPLTVTLTMDGQTVTATIDLGVAGDPGCWSSSNGTACCMTDPPGSDFDCVPEAKGDLRISLHPTTGLSDLAKHDVSAFVKGNFGTVIVDSQGTVELHMRQPNGPDCEPTCFQGGIDFEVGGP